MSVLIRWLATDIASGMTALQNVFFNIKVPSSVTDRLTFKVLRWARRLDTRRVLLKVKAVRCPVRSRAWHQSGLVRSPENTSLSSPDEGNAALRASRTLPAPSQL